MKKVFLFFTIIFTLLSCSLEDDGQNFEIETLPIKAAELPDRFQFGESYDVTVTYELPNRCYSFESLYYQYDGTSRVVAINAFVNNQNTCTQESVEQQHTFKVRVSQREDYIFKFWKGKDANNEDVFEEVVIPVVDDISQTRK